MNSGCDEAAEEGVEVGFLDRVGRGRSAWPGSPIGHLPILGDEVDPDVAAASPRPFVPEPDPRQLRPVLGDVLQEPLAQPLEVPAAGSERRQQTVEGSGTRHLVPREDGSARSRPPEPLRADQHLSRPGGRGSSFLAYRAADGALVNRDELDGRRGSRRASRSTLAARLFAARRPPSRTRAAPRGRMSRRASPSAVAHPHKSRMTGSSRPGSPTSSERWRARRRGLDSQYALDSARARADVPGERRAGA